MFGTTIWFIPNPKFRGWAALAGVAYYAVLWAYRPHLRSGEMHSTAWTKAKQALAIPVFCYFSYVAFYITIPTGLTQVFGSPASRQYVVSDIQQSSKKALLCPYRVRLAGVRTVLSDSLCAGMSFVETVSLGERVNFYGKESFFGFRVSDSAR